MALDLCHELATKHRDMTYDLDKLVQLYNQQAALWTRIGQSVRMKPEYYRMVSIESLSLVWGYRRMRRSCRQKADRIGIYAEERDCS
jgi:hypothetical protein